MVKARCFRPSPPTSSLPPLSQLANCSFEQIAKALENLRSIYIDGAPLVSTPKHLPKHLIHDTSVPDSGYASAEEDNDECDDEDSYDIDILRSDSFERDFAIRWLTGFTARSDLWVCTAPSDEESDARAALVDSAASILSAFVGEDEEEALTREFTFPSRGEERVVAVLNDAPLLSEDHTSVGLQSWGSSILFAERICASPERFGFDISHCMPRILELGAGTGLLSIIAGKILQRSPHARTTVVSTDYHPSVLANLRHNIETNFPECSVVSVRALDWEHPTYDGELASPFDTVLAADVIYHPQHALWIKECVEHLLVRPSGRDSGGTFWLIIPLRPTGRHEGMSGTVEAVFPRACRASVECDVGAQVKLAIVASEGIERLQGVGRADEGGYKLYEIGWVAADA